MKSMNLRVFSTTHDNYATGKMPRTLLHKLREAIIAVLSSKEL